MKVAPHNLEAEKSLLGGVLLAGALDEVAGLVRAADFYSPAHRLVWAACEALATRGEPIDYVTLSEELRRAGSLDAAGGIAGLAMLDASVPTSANLDAYARTVRETSQARGLLTACREIAKQVYEMTDLQALLDSAESIIFSSTEKLEKRNWHGMRDLTSSAFKRLEVLFERQEDITGVPSGLEQLDKMTAGFQPGDLIILAARPSMGKTALALGVGSHLAIETQQPVAVFSLEMSAESLATRMLASEARVDGQRLRTGKLFDSDWPKLARAADRMHRAPIYIDDEPGPTVLDVRSKCRRLSATHGQLGLVIVDYLQLMRGSGRKDASREQEISEISRGLKALARELNCPVVALSQLNRSLEKREDKRPMLSDLRESGAIEQDADVIVFVYRDDYYNKDSNDHGIAELIVGKQRNGPTGTARVAFLRDYTRFENLRDE